MTFFIPGEPVAKGRGRTFVHKNTGHMTTMTPEKTRVFEAELKHFAQQAMRGRALFEGPLFMVYCAVFQWPASWSPKKRAANCFKISRPDMDNLVKCSDALNGIVFRDDAQIVMLSAAKMYGDKPGVQIKVGVAA